MTRLQKALKDLTCKGYQFTTVEQLSGGINSAVFKVKSSNKANFALKLYPIPTKSDPRDRCKTEISFLKYLQTSGVSRVPTLRESSEETGWALLSWIEGNKPTNLTMSDIQGITEFIHEINDKSTQDARSQLPPASEACESLAQMIKCVAKRLQQIQSTRRTTNVEQQAMHWLERTIQPYFDTSSQKLLDSQRNCSHWRRSEMHKIASPSDVGIHNSLQTKSGLHFLDFEYAGLDDLSKLAADWILQPEYIFDQDQEEKFCNLLLLKMKIATGTSWLDRLKDIKPLIQIKWCLIMLNKLQSHKLSKEQFQKTMRYFEQR
jgi:hypothetical protein